MPEPRKRGQQNARRKEMKNIGIREARPDDADPMREVQRHTWIATYPNETYGITKEDIEARFREDPETARERRARRRQSMCTAPFHSWVALEETGMIGFCLVKQDDQENLVQALYVLPSFQSQGVGKRLLQTALDWLGSEKEAVLNVASYNEKAIAFYRAFGFVSTGPVVSEEALQLPSGVRLPEIRMVKKGMALGKPLC
jgi:ribosomal protein S18 acetylase RimI-like enzyme